MKVDRRNAKVKNNMENVDRNICFLYQENVSSYIQYIILNIFPSTMADFDEIAKT